MSFNRENVQWESPDGTWNLGFFEVVWEGDDPEWDVEYDFGRFWWVSTGHGTPDAAWSSWRGANPGFSVQVAYAGNEDECERYDEMARECKERQDRW